MTFLALFFFLLILFAAGLPLAIWLRHHADGRRVLLAPVLGLGGVVLFTAFLASFGMTGRMIGKVALIATGLAGAAALFLPRLWPRLAAMAGIEGFSRQECRAAAPALCLGLFGCALTAWPLFLAGCTDYWGFANPDQAFYITIVDHLEHHPFGSPPAERVHSATGVNPATILGLCYLFPMVSILTGIPSIFLFGVLCAAMIFLLPAGVYVLCRTGLDLSAGTAVVAGLLAAVSSVGAQTFYHHSLGALAVAAVCPTGLTLASLYIGKAEFRTAVLLALLPAGMLFCYFPGFAVLGIVLAGWFSIPLLRGKLRIRSLLLVGGLTVLLMPLVSSRQCLELFRSLTKEAVSDRMARVEDEIILSIDAILTDEIVPSIWGLRTLGVSSPRLFESAYLADAILFAGGAVFLAITIFGLWKGRGIPREFKAMLCACVAVTGLFFIRDNGYGVYKLITWLGPLIVVALAVSCMALFTHSTGFVRKLALLVLSAYASLNTAQTVRLAGYSRSAESSGANNVRGVTLSEMHALETGVRLARPRNVFVAVPDQVLQRWATPFLPDPNAYYLPMLNLDTTDSDSIAATQYRLAAVSKLDDGYLLYPAPALRDIVPALGTRFSIWHNRVFAIAPLERMRNVLLLGAGWYRRETSPEISGKSQEFRWLRKRAEFLVLNPAPGPQRLRLRVVAGYGNTSPNRHLVLFLNGEKFDEVTISGQSRFLSRPFTATGRAAQLEVMVREDAQMLPRTYGLWNRWVPRDARRLNLGVLEAGLETSTAPSPAVPSSLDFSELQLGGTDYDGIYSDAWLGGRVSVEMRIPSRSESLRIRGSAPSGTSLVFPLRIHFDVDDEPLGEAVVPAPGNFDVAVPVPASFSGNGARDARVSIQPKSNCFVGKGETRCLTVRLERLSFDAAP